MDADYEGEGVEVGGRKGRRKRQVLDPSTITLQKEELSSRLKGELFSYRAVEPIDYGLTTEEVCTFSPHGRHCTSYLAPTLDAAIISGKFHLL